MHWIWKWLIVTGASGLVAVLVLFSPNKAERTPQAPAFHGTRVDEAPILRIPRVRATVGRWQGRSNVANVSARHVASTAMFAPVVGHHFDPWVSYPVDLGGTYSVAIGDVTGDKRDDLVVATYRYDLPGDSSVLVYRQASNGTLLAPDKYPHYGGPDPALALAHLNGDDVLDIVVGRDRGLTTLVHSGAGFVVTKVDASSAFFDMEAVAALDVDRDSFTDVVVQTRADGAVVFYGSGRGGFRRIASMRSSGTGAADLAVGDVDNNGTQDALLTAPDSGAFLKVLPIGTAGGFTPERTLSFPTDWSRPRQSVIGDFNGDGRADVAFGRHDDGQNAALVFFFQGSTGAFAPAASVPTATSPGSMAAADFDRNGRDDLVALHAATNAIGIYMQGPAGMGTSTMLPIPEQPYSAGPTVTDLLATGDLDSNGCIDIAYSNGEGVLVFKGRDCRPRTLKALR